MKGMCIINNRNVLSDTDVETEDDRILFVSPMCCLYIMSYLVHLQLQKDFGISSAVQTICSYHVSLSRKEYGKQIGLIIKQTSMSNSVDMTCLEGGCISSIDFISSIQGVDQSIRLKVSIAIVLVDFFICFNRHEVSDEHSFLPCTILFSF